MIFMTKTPLSLILEPVTTNLKEEYTLTFIELKTKWTLAILLGGKPSIQNPPKEENSASTRHSVIRLGGSLGTLGRVLRKLVPLRTWFGQAN